MDDRADHPGIPERPQLTAVEARTLAKHLVGSGVVRTLSHQSLVVGWRHQWKLLWSWWFDAREVLVEVMIDTRVPSELQARAAALLDIDAGEPAIEEDEKVGE